RQAKKTTLLSTAFDNQKKATYDSARKQAKETSQEGLGYLEDLRVMLLELKKDEIPFKKYSHEVDPLWKNRETSLASLYDLYPSVVDDLFVRRAQVIDDASGMIRINPSKREKALRSFLENARREVDRSRQKEIVGICVSFFIGKIQFNHVGGNGRIETYQALQSPSLWLTHELDILSPAISHSESLLLPCILVCVISITSTARATIPK
ncbi:hypothetical protein F5051DRAFT_327040, partial [Lentinula edodes]